MHSILTRKREAAKDALARTIVEYWDERSATYSNGVREEFGSFVEDEFRALFQEALSSVPVNGASTARVLDLGCGPGFFSSILSSMGCSVTALDSSSNMLGQAMCNVAEHGEPARTRFVLGDVDETGLDGGSFELIVMRNVTWLLKKPLEALSEWKRLLVPGGRMLLFDANWYRYLVDERLNARRLCDQRDISRLGLDADARANDDQEARCEAIALSLPLTYEMRPAWDVQALHDLGFSSVRADEGIWRRVWSEGEKEFYASSPLFMVEAVK